MTRSVSMISMLLQRDRARDRVARPGEAVEERVVAVLEGLGDPVRDDHRAERGVPAVMPFAQVIMSGT